ncbi:unnamed protein product [marine sediment metagenome]|uniref:Uncharacterized protein n=1 Tax=marine sediment metagenome TaxID=412755 RepID=X1HRF9_9ZZZZ
MAKKRSRPETYPTKIGGRTVRVTVPDAIDQDVLFDALRDNLSPRAIAAVISCLRINRTNNRAVDEQVHWFAEELVKLLGGPGQQTRLAEELGL